MEPAGARDIDGVGRDHNPGGVLLTSGGAPFNFFAERKRRDVDKVAVV